MKMNLTGAIEILKLHKHTTDKFKHSIGDKYVSDAIDTVVTELEKPLPTDEQIEQYALENILDGVGIQSMINTKAWIAGARWMRDLKNGNKKALAEITNPVNDVLKRADDIICHEFCVTYDDLHRRTRLRHIVEARQMAMYVRRKIFNLSLHQSANDFGLNQATALWSVRQVEVLICNDKLFKARAQRVLAAVGEIKKFYDKR
jgi:hypothetical protein